MKKIIYHGSEKIIERPVFGYGKVYNDYGLGFYCTEVPDLAMEWSVDADRNGFANQYEIETDGLNIFDLNGEGYCILHWLAILLKNRHFDVQSALASDAREYLIGNFSVPLDGVDVVTGYRADDSYFSFAMDFLNGTISYRQLNNALHLGKLGTQFVLISKKAFDRVVFIDAVFADKNIWFARKELRDKTARREYFDAERSKRQKGDLYITGILDEEMKPNDVCLR